MRVEIYKTNVNDWKHARALVRSIHQSFPTYRANFDLEDCDHILRVASDNEEIFSSQLIPLLEDLGCIAEVLQEAIEK